MKKRRASLVLVSEHAVYSASRSLWLYTLVPIDQIIFVKTFAGLNFCVEAMKYYIGLEVLQVMKIILKSKLKDLGSRVGNLTMLHSQSVCDCVRYTKKTSNHVLAYITFVFEEKRIG